MAWSILFIVLVASLQSCSPRETTLPGSGPSKKQGTEADSIPERIKLMATAKYGADINYLFNSTRTHVVCLQKIKPTTTLPLTPANFIVYDLRSEKIIYDESLTSGDVKWISDQEILVTVTPGIVRGESSEDSNSYIYDIKSGTKREKNSSKIPD